MSRMYLLTTVIYRLQLQHPSYPLASSLRFLSGSKAIIFFLQVHAFVARKANSVDLTRPFRKSIRSGARSRVHVA